jgi:hypothetical protein
VNEDSREQAITRPPSLAPTITRPTRWSRLAKGATWGGRTAIPTLISIPGLARGGRALRRRRLDQPGGQYLRLLPPIQVGLAAHSAPLGLAFLENSDVQGPLSGGRWSRSTFTGSPAAPVAGRVVDGTACHHRDARTGGHPRYRLPRCRRQPMGSSRRCDSWSRRRPLRQRRRGWGHQSPRDSKELTEGPAHASAERTSSKTVNCESLRTRRKREDGRCRVSRWSLPVRLWHHHQME